MYYRNNLDISAENMDDRKKHHEDHEKEDNKFMPFMYYPMMHCNPMMHHLMMHCCPMTQHYGMMQSPQMMQGNHMMPHCGMHGYMKNERDDISDMDLDYRSPNYDYYHHHGYPYHHHHHNYYPYYHHHYPYYNYFYFPYPMPYHFYRP